MAIAFDAASGPSNTGGVSSMTFAHTCTGSDRILFAGFRDKSAASTLIGTVTYNGVGMTAVNAGVRVPGERFVTLWYLVAPATGANNIVVTASSGNFDDIWGAGVSYTGANQSGQPDNQTTNTASGATSITTSLTSVADNCWAVLMERNANPGGTIVAGTGSTGRVLDTGQGTGMLDSGGPTTPAGNISMQVTWTNSASAGNVMASFAPVSSAGSTSHNLTLLGVGS